MSALVITTLLVMVAIVIDLGATRSDRRGGQLAADNSAAAAGLTLAEFGAVAACEDALAFLQASLDTSPFTITDGPTCADKFSATCISTGPSATAPRTLVATSGAYTVRVHHPVNASNAATQHLLDRTSTIGAESLGGITSADGEACERIAVELTTEGEEYFGGIAGSDGRSSTVHAVARGEEISGEARPINLLVLHRTDCQVLTVSGTSNVVIEIPTDAPDVPGIVGADSNATTNCTGGGPDGNKAAVEVSGTLTAKGLCDDGSLLCGIIDIFRDVPNGACTKDLIDVPACKAIGGGDVENDNKIRPNATTAVEQVTRSPFDYIYNCKDSYSSESWNSLQPIDGCVGATSSTDYVDELLDFASGISAASVPDATWSVVPSATVPGFDSCNVGGTVVVPAGNYFVDCTTFKVSAGGSVTFTGGNLVFGGKVDVPGSATLNLHACAVAPLTCGTTQSSWTPGTDFEESSWSARNAWAYVAEEFRAAGTLSMNKTTLFIDDGGYFNKNGSGTTAWIAPDESSADDPLDSEPDDDEGSAGPFDDLSMWSESSSDHTFAGGGASEWEGVFFGPLARYVFSGSAPMDMRSAQFAAEKMSFAGNTTYTMSPVSSRAVPTTLGYRTELIR